MKLCKNPLCKKPNSRNKSTCSYECEIEVIKQREKKKKEKQKAKVIAPKLKAKPKKAKGQLKGVIIDGKSRNWSYKRLKNECWNIFSLYIRLRDSNKDGMCYCISCGSKHYYKEMQAGHYIGGRGNSVLFHEDIVNAQCVACNIFAGGNYIDYHFAMRKKYSERQLQEFNQLKHKVVKFKISDLVAIYDLYSQKVNNLLEEKNIK